MGESDSSRFKRRRTFIKRSTNHGINASLYTNKDNAKAVTYDNILLSMKSANFNTKLGGHTAIKHSRQGLMTILQIKYHIHVNAFRVKLQMNDYDFSKYIRSYESENPTVGFIQLKQRVNFKVYIYSTMRVRLSTLDANLVM